MEIICYNKKCTHNICTHCSRKLKFIKFDDKGTCTEQEYDEYNDENIIEALEKPYKEFKEEGRLKVITKEVKYNDI